VGQFAHHVWSVEEFVGLLEDNLPLRQSRAVWVVGWIIYLVVAVISFRTAPWLLWRPLGTLGALILLFSPVVAGLYLARMYERWHRRDR
jgi:hypothetical protein